MERLCCVTLCLLGLGLFSTNAFEVEIKDDSNKTCIYASMSIRFTIQYETSDGTSKNVTYAAPDKVTTEGSTCGEVPLLNVHFGDGYLWSLNFTKNDEEYRGSVLSFTYNASDSTLFPDAKTKGLVTSATDKNIFVPIPLKEVYKCVHDDTVTAEHVVQLYRNVTLQAYIDNSTLGKDFHCTADTPTPVPTTHIPTTHITTTASTANTTTANTTTASTTPTTTAKPTPKPVDKPAVGNYTLYNGTEPCLLASMGLQLNVSQQVEGKHIWIARNIDPNNTASSGSCGNETAFLRLMDNTTATIVEFYFLTKKNKFHLQEVNVTLHNGSGTKYRTNVNLSFWEASVGNAYLCRKEQLITVSEDLLINTFDVKVQPFSIHNGTYGTASECHLDDDSILIPIIVGAALSGLIVIIVIAYLIGRRKTYAGYQTL
ncbi:lysosome-associated membrane glycoprotein 2 isoform 2-T2 [Mantella aurantiaca]